MMRPFHTGIMDVRNSAIAGLKVIDPEEFIATFVLKLKGATVVLSANRHGITEAFSEKGADQPLRP